MIMLKAYYNIKSILPRRLQIFLRRHWIQIKRQSCHSIWPIPFHLSEPMATKWFDWPEQKQFALILTHDVDTAQGQAKCNDLLELEKSFGFRSSFNFVPERYRVSAELRKKLTNQDFEVGVHGLNHDGRLYESKQIFQQRALRINHYLNEWNSVGFRSPAMHHNLDWIHDLNIEYDASTFDTDPFEPHPDGVGTIFPFIVHKKTTGQHYVELPYTLPQDFTLYVLMRETTIDIWKKKLDWIVSHGGMALLITHPDYMSFQGKQPGLEEYPADYYAEFLAYVKDQYADCYWHALPQDISRFCMSQLEASSQDASGRAKSSNRHIEHLSP